MQNFKEISHLREFILSKLDPGGRVLLPELFLETFLYDGLFSLEKEQKLIKPRQEHISNDKRGKVRELSGIEEKLENIVAKAAMDFKENPLVEFVDRMHPMESGVLPEVYIFSKIYESLPEIFPKMKKVELNTKWKNLEDLLEFTRDFLFIALGREIFRTENLSKSMIITNTFLSVLKLPQMIIYHRDRARVLRALDSKSSFDKEFSLTLLNFLHKMIAIEIFPEMNIGFEALKQERGLIDVYVPLGYSWYERIENGDLLKHTYRDYKTVDKNISLS